jgi:hypothetical protein
MKSIRDIGRYGLFLCNMVFVLLLVSNTGISATGTEAKTTKTLIWDTSSPFGDSVDLQNRTTWKIVPTNLFTLERDPAAAESDPGYSGLEYAFKGDAVVENEHLTMVFHSKKGCVAVYSKGNTNGKKLEFVPLEFKGGPVKISRCLILQNTGQDAALQVTFAGEGKNLSAIFEFDRTGIVDIQPGEDMKGVSLISSIEYGIVPSFIGDDLIFNPADYASSNTLCVPADNLFVGLLAGQNDMLVVTWPRGRQRMKLMLGDNHQKPRLVESVDFDNDGKSLYLAVLSAPGIWHEEELKPSYLEKNVTIDWKRPFHAKWITQLSEDRVPATYTFKESESRIWRGVIGHYTWPVWFSNDEACYRLSKKIPPIGESVIYCLERKDTPDSILTPVDIMKMTLGRQMSDAILDVPGRKLRTHHRRGAKGVHRACTCGCTAAIRAVFDARQEVQRKEYVVGAVDDMVFFVTQHMGRIGEYQAFARDMMEFLNQERKSAPDLKPYLDKMEEIVQEIPGEYQSKREVIKSLKYAGELARQTKALTLKKQQSNLEDYKQLGVKWRRMGGAQDDLVAQCHRITRNLFQQAGYDCTGSPEAVKIAEQIRTRCRKCLRNADGYEIWTNY